MTTPKKRREHYVARSYLRGFAENDMLRAWFRTWDDYREVHINNVAVENDFYDLRLADGTPCDELEDALSVFDGMTPNILRRAVQPTVSAATLQQVRHLYATMMARGHQGRDWLLPETRLLRTQAEEMYDADFPNSGAEHRESIINYLMREVYDVPAHLSADADTISRLNILKLTGDLLNVLPSHVCILRSTAQFFFTSDAPFAYFDASEGAPREGVTGPKSMSSPTLELTMPLDHTHAAFLANRPLPPTVTANFGTVRVINARTAFFAKRAVFAYPRDDKRQLFLPEVLASRNAFATPLLTALDEALN